MMATEKAEKERQVRVSFRMPEWLYEDMTELARQSGHDFSKQARLELAAARGKATLPKLPGSMNPKTSFLNPTDEAPGRRKRRSRR